MSSRIEATLARFLWPAVGAGLVLLATTVPSAAWIGLLRDVSSGLPSALATGAVILRWSLAALGLFLIVGSRIGWWRAAPRPGVAASSEPGWARPTVGQQGLAVGLLVVGAVLRLYRLDGGMWNDEVVTLVESVRPSLGDILTTYSSQNQHYLFSILAHVSIQAFGESAWALRLPAALFGIATLWAMWRFSQLLAGPREALLATAMLTFSYQHIWFSQNARGYSALLFWALVSSHFLVRGLREDNRRMWACYAVSAALGTFTHMTMIFVVAGQLAAYAWQAARARGVKAEERLAPFFGGFALAGLLTVLCYAIVLPQIPAASAADRSDVAVWRSPAWMLQELGRGAMAGPWLPVAALLGLGIVGVGAVSFARRSATLPLLFAVPVISGAVTMVALGHHLWPRFFFFAAGFAILFVVRGISGSVEAAGQLFRWTPARTAMVGTLLVLLAVAVLGRSLSYVYGPKQDYEGALRAVQQGRGAGDAVVVVGGGATAFRLYFAPEWTSVSTSLELQRIRTSHARTWLVYAIPIEVENSYPEVYRSAQQDFQLVGVFRGTLNGGDVYVYRADRPELAPEPAGSAGREGA